jgi:uncharacterized RDD family membrane protein YckC
MKEQLSIDTPEQIELNYDIAGIGSRACAAMIDSTLIGVLMWLGWYLMFSVFSSGMDGTLNNWLIAILSLITFSIYWGYYIVFDLVRNGQSPGKRALKLRVIKNGGYPIGFGDSAIRNLVRIVDFLPMFYAIGIVSMILDKRWRRLGDLAAGTLVVKERTDLTPAQLVISVDAKSNFTYADRIRPEMVTPMELSTIREYLPRRRMLSAQRRGQLARTIGQPIAQKMGVEEPIDFNLFLEEVYAMVTRRNS